MMFICIYLSNSLLNIYMSVGNDKQNDYIIGKYLP